MSVQIYGQRSNNPKEKSIVTNLFLNVQSKMLDNYSHYLIKMRNFIYFKKLHTNLLVFIQMWTQTRMR